MKTPRLTDFDPDAKAPTLKSSLEKMPAIEKPLNKAPVLKKSPTPRQLPSTPSKASESTRAFTTRTFNLYEDQIDYLVNVYTPIHINTHAPMHL
jgi:hypothetical protein